MCEVATLASSWLGRGGSDRRLPNAPGANVVGACRPQALKSGVGVSRQAGGQELDHRGDRVIRGRYIQAPVEVVHRRPVRQALNPKLRDLAFTQLVLGEFGVFRKDQSLKGVSVELAPYPASTKRLRVLRVMVKSQPRSRSVVVMVVSPMRRVCD